MDEINRRLVRCFECLFPALSPETIELATMDTVGGWDSLATVKLVALIEEEFAVVIDPVDVTSYRSIKEYLANSVSS